MPSLHILISTGLLLCLLPILCTSTYNFNIIISRRPLIGEVGIYGDTQFNTSVHIYVLYVTTLQHCGGIRAVQALLFK